MSKGKPIEEGLERRGQSMLGLPGHDLELGVGAKCDGKPWECLSSRMMQTDQHFLKGSVHLENANDLRG